jgi:hypothetical protein
MLTHYNIFTSLYVMQSMIVPFSFLWLHLCTYDV